MTLSYLLEPSYRSRSTSVPAGNELTHIKLNYKRIADYYGDGATYDAIEGRFRLIKKQAAKLKDEVEGGRPIAPPRGSNKSADTTPRKPKTPRNHDSQDSTFACLPLSCTTLTDFRRLEW